MRVNLIVSASLTVCLSLTRSLARSLSRSLALDVRGCLSEWHFAYHFEDTDKPNDVDGREISRVQSPNKHEDDDNQVAHQPRIAEKGLEAVV
jgi:hypothetical protein